jgi:hypothetical protein
VFIKVRGSTEEPYVAREKIIPLLKAPPVDVIPSNKMLSTCNKFPNGAEPVMLSK